MDEISRKFFELMGFSVKNPLEDNPSAYFLYYWGRRTDEYVLAQAESIAWEKLFSDYLDDFAFHLAILERAEYGGIVQFSPPNVKKVIVERTGFTYETDYYVDPCHSIRKAVVVLEKRITGGTL